MLNPQRFIRRATLSGSRYFAFEDSDADQDDEEADGESLCGACTGDDEDDEDTLAYKRPRKGCEGGCCSAENCRVEHCEAEEVETCCKHARKARGKPCTAELIARLRQEAAEREGREARAVVHHRAIAHHPVPAARGRTAMSVAKAPTTGRKWNRRVLRPNNVVENHKTQPGV